MKLKGFGITGRMVIIVLTPVIVLAIFMSAFTGYSGYKNIYDEVSHELSSVCVSVFELLEHSEEYKSSRYEYFDENADMFDNITERTDIYITVFEGDERRITTIRNADGSRAVGTKAAANVVETVINGGQEFSSDNVDVNGSEFFGFYMPIKNGGKVTGMVFAGKSRGTVLMNVTKAVLGALVVSWFVALAAAVLSVLVSRGMVSSLISAAEFLKKISLGDTDCTPSKHLVTRKDEIGDMGRSAEKLQKALKALISNDPLTGLYNRRACNLKMNELLAKAENGGSFSVAIGDIDLFKRFNDNYGHACGDVVLKDVARLLSDGMGEMGFVSRWGGEEFLMVFGGAPYEECVETLYRIAENIRGYKCEYDGLKLAVTMSFGISEYTGGTIDSLVSSADDKLYYAKNHGRNCIIERIPEECGEESG